MENKTLTTLNDAQLHTSIYDWVKKLCESGGNAWTLRVPADHNVDPDLLITELINRHKALLEKFTLLQSEPTTALPYTIPNPSKQEVQGAEDLIERILLKAPSYQINDNPFKLYLKSNVVAAMQEFASQERSKAIQECIDNLEEINKKPGFYVNSYLISELEKLKK